jgi:hypothetical protein
MGEDASPLGCSLPCQGHRLQTPTSRLSTLSRRDTAGEAARRARAAPSPRVHVPAGVARRRRRGRARRGRAVVGLLARHLQRAAPGLGDGLLLDGVAEEPAPDAGPRRQRPHHPRPTHQPGAASRLSSVPRRPTHGLLGVGAWLTPLVRWRKSPISRMRPAREWLCGGSGVKGLAGWSSASRSVARPSRLSVLAKRSGLRDSRPRGGRT